MLISKIETLKQIKSCIEMYALIGRADSLPLDTDKAIKALSSCIRRRKFVRAAMDGDEILGWILAEEVDLGHVSKKVLMQKYFCTNTVGIRSYLVIKLLHNELLEYAKAADFDYVVSTNAALEGRNQLVKILEILGWERIGYKATFKIK